MTTHLSMGALTALVLAAVTPAQKKVDFKSQVLPLLNRACFECHSDPTPKKRAKGGLRLDGFALMLKGGDGGPVVIPGNPDRSELLARIDLPPGDPDLMPPKGKRFDARERALVRRWIKEGSRFGGWRGAVVAEKKKPATTVPRTGREARTPRRAKVLKKLAEGLRPADPAAIERARAGLAIITPVSEGSPLLRVSYASHEADVTNEVVAALSAIRNNIAVLSLRRCDQVGDVALVSCGQMPRLTVLDLSQTKVTDTGLSRLSLLHELRHLKLYGTRISDVGLDKIGRMPQIESVHIWKTRTTPGGARMLERRLKRREPEARVVRDPGLPKPPPRRR